MMHRDACELELNHHRAEQLRRQVLVPAYCRIHREVLCDSLAFASNSCSHFFRMHHRRRHVVVGDHHLDALDRQLLVHQLQMDH